MPTANSAGGGNPSAAASYLKNPESSEVLWGAVIFIPATSPRSTRCPPIGLKGGASGILSIYLENIIMEKSGSSGRRVHSDQGREVRRAAALIVLHAEHFGKIGENDIRPASRLLRRARRISRSLSRKT